MNSCNNRLHVCGFGLVQWLIHLSFSGVVIRCGGVFSREVVLSLKDKHKMLDSWSSELTVYQLHCWHCTILDSVYSQSTLPWVPEMGRFRAAVISSGPERGRFCHGNVHRVVGVCALMTKFSALTSKPLSILADLVASYGCSTEYDYFNYISKWHVIKKYFSLQ